MIGFRYAKASILGVVIFILIGWAGCEHAPTQKKTVPETKVEAGERLSKIYCTSCHLYPEPELLDKKTWEHHILVRMGAFMGIFTDNIQYYDTLPSKWLEPGIGGQRVIAAGIYPSQPLLSREDFEKIEAFYLEKSPEILAGAPNPDDIDLETKHFKAKPLLKGTGWQPYTFGVKIHGPSQRIYAGLYKQDVLAISKTGEVLDWMGANLATTDISIEKDRITLTDLGSMIGADTPKGKMTSWKNFTELKKAKNVLTMDSLQRPVQSQWHDLDQDGKEDLLICEYGNFLGHLAWFKDLGNGKFKKNILYPDDGTMRALVHDFNRDSLPDIIALVGNGDEGIYIYINEGNGNFRKKRILQFPPTHGSTWMELVDMNADGELDILYTNGDNGDYPPILKPHHGVRLFLNQGNLTFKEEWYLPLNGANRAEAHDFDQDGDLDIAAISFYPDFASRPEEAFVLFENKGENQFTASTFPEFDYGRWMVFDVGDVDQDGDLDIVLGAFNQESVETPEAVKQAWKAYDTPLMLLENTLK